MNTENFYFEEFVGDYYLSKDAEGVSHLKVSQKMTTIFPDYNQNKGICLEIASTNQGGKNLTLPKLGRSDIKIWRNGETEPIYSIEKWDGYYEVCTGTDDYVLGRQEYVFEYEYEKVITDFESYQELYWDTNGNGWSQEFNAVTARVHLDEEVAEDFTGESWCYVGKYGESGSERCEITKTSDGMEFTAKDLAAYENLTFDMEFKPESFVVPEPPVNYGFLWILLIVAGICGVILAFAAKKLMKVWPKRKFYKELFVKPEYQPNANYTLEEMTKIYIGEKKDFKVGMLLNLVVRKKVEIIKGEKKKWSIRILTLEGVSENEKNLLEILSGGKVIEAGQEIEIKSRMATRDLERINDGMERRIVREMKGDELVEGKYEAKTTSEKGQTIGVIITAVSVGVPVLMIAIAFLADWFGALDATGEVFLEESFIGILIAILVATTVIWLIMERVRKKYEFHTEKGLTASRYMDGLKMYISMAEAERMKFLQSVEGADVSPSGVVHLYEKLLPYAAVFGLEESWMRELGRYCEVQAVPEPDYLGVVGATEMSRLMRQSAMYVSRASVYHSSTGSGISGGGGFSSFSSGGGGGGFSGGGGGGGGGHGR